VHANRDATRTRRDVVSRQCALMPFVELAVCGERERVSRDDAAGAERLQRRLV
jgi:hypothetical protein